MTDYVRVRQAETGHELSVPRGHYEAAPKGGYVLLDKAATYPGGDPLPPKYKTTVAQAAEKKAGTKAVLTEKE